MAFVPYLILYFLIQSLITAHQYNLLTDIDTWIPFVPQFIWVYHTIIPVTVLTCLVLFKRRDVFLSLIYSNLVAGVVLCFFYIFLPAFYPREAFVDTNTMSGMLVEFTRTIDGAHNTFPSGHVTFAWILALFVNLSQKGKSCKWLCTSYFCWAILLSISTVTLKQHYFIDVISGVALAGIIFYIFKKLPQFRNSTKLVTIDAKLIPPRTPPAEVPVDC